ncbi:MAG: type II toxin-antitoxin system RelE/ParE family toxin [Bacteroidetes bacterium]|nr:type II toxin-antitoxin system RelE/ParE family toxin [Bacteroidota bacterium]
MIITEEAQHDIDAYIDTIIYTYDAPMTAKKHRDALLNVLKTIKKYPEANPIRDTISLKQYGLHVRRANFKKMAILYTINKNVVYVHRVVAASLITE